MHCDYAKKFLIWRPFVCGSEIRVISSIFSRHAMHINQFDMFRTLCVNSFFCSVPYVNSTRSYSWRSLVLSFHQSISYTNPNNMNHYFVVYSDESMMHFISLCSMFNVLISSTSYILYLITRVFHLSILPSFVRLSANVSSNSTVAFYIYPLIGCAFFSFERLLSIHNAFKIYFASIR